MDVRTLKRACGVGLLVATALTNPAANAANGSVDVNVNLPTVLIMYYYSTIDLNLDAAALAGYLTLGGAPCALGGDYCDDQGNPGAQSVTTIGPVTTVTLAAPTDPYGGSAPITFVLENAVAVRALGCATYDAGFDVTGDNGIVAAIDSPVTNIDTVGCSMTLTPGDLDFDLDFDLVDAAATTVSATLDVTITGIP